MLEKHVIELSARDTLSPVLRKVGTEAESAGRKAEQSAQRASRSMADWDKAGRALGAGLVTLGGLAVKLSNDSEVAQSRLEQSIKNTGAAYEVSSRVWHCSPQTYCQQEKGPPAAT